MICTVLSYKTIHLSTMESNKIEYNRTEQTENNINCFPICLKMENVQSGDVISSMEKGLPLTLGIFQETFRLILKPS